MDRDGRLVSEPERAEQLRAFFEEIRQRTRQDAGPEPEEEEAESRGNLTVCGEHLEWAFDGASGTLTISGTGEMNDFEFDTDAFLYLTPWKDDREEVRAVVIEKGVTSIGEGAFSDCANLTQVILPDSIKMIKDDAFGECEKLCEIRLPEGLQRLEAAFGAGIETLELPTSLEEIEAGAFCDRSSLEEIGLPRSVTSMGKRAFPL